LNSEVGTAAAEPKTVLCTSQKNGGALCCSGLA